jgi:16S rRNA (adenine1518-N6/adenine1519-N6)-dimethyltransferase
MHVRPKKHLGQHFLKEEAIARRIADSLTRHGDYVRVIEIGPGTGALTVHLLARKDIDTVCIELDQESVVHLRERWPQLRLIEGDVLGMDLALGSAEPFAIAGNFPYNISTEIVFRVLHYRQQCTEVVGMFQKEVADRLCAPPGSRTYGITSVLAQAWYHVELLFTVEPGSFIPPPKVRSAVVHMRRNATAKLPCSERAFIALVKMAFNQRRKTLRNALRTFPGLAVVPEAYAGLRAEQLAVADFVRLAQAANTAPL